MKQRETCQVEDRLRGPLGVMATTHDDGRTSLSFGADFVLELGPEDLEEVRKLVARLGGAAVDDLAARHADELGAALNEHPGPDVRVISVVAFEGWAVLDDPRSVAIHAANVGPDELAKLFRHLADLYAARGHG